MADGKDKKARPRDAATAARKVARTAANKARRAATRERRLQKNRDRYRGGMTYPEWKKSAEYRFRHHPDAAQAV